MGCELQEYKKRKWYERYRSSLKQLKPVRTKAKAPSHVMPGPVRGFLSLYSLHWLSKLMWKACRNKLVPDDIWSLQKEDQCERNAERLGRLWRQELELKGEHKASLTATVLRAFRTRIVMTTLLLVTANTLAILGPSVLLRQMIIYLNDRSAPGSQAVLLVVLMVVLRFFSIYFMAGAFGLTSVFSGARATGALQVLVFQKVLRLASASDQILGKVVNICINDMTRLNEALRMAAFVFSAILMTLYGLTINLIYVGPWSLSGFVVVGVSLAFLGVVGGMVSQKRQKVVTVTDRRVTFMSEVLEAIRLIKMYAWEDSFEEKIHDIRREETTIIRQSIQLNSLSQVLVPMVPVVATAVSIIGYVVSGNELRSAEAFTMFSVFNSLQMAIGTMPYGIRVITESHVSLRRIQRLLLMKDLETTTGQCEDPRNAVELNYATLAWDKPVVKKSKKKRERDAWSAQARATSGPSPPSHQQDSLFSRVRAFSQRRRLAESASSCTLDEETATHAEVVLHELQLSVRAGRLLGVAGSVGSGKSSLLVGITGQLGVIGGEVRCAGQVAMVPQRAWIFSGTIRDNILFGRPLIPDLYERTVRVCALTADLALMPDGDLSEIGDRGVNLSGGQKQRVNLARAVYADADVYLLDDPLSAVDAHVGQHIFQQCIQTALRHKTVVLVSHGVQYLSRCEEVLYMRDGRVAERGTHAQLMAIKGGYSELVKCDAASEQKQQQPAEQKRKPADDDEMNSSGGKFTTEEVISTKSVFKNFATYFKYLGAWRVLTVFLLTLTFASLRTLGGVYLKYWIDAGDGKKALRIRNATLNGTVYNAEELAGAINDHPDREIYMGAYGGLVAALLLMGLIKALCHATVVVRGARRVHDLMVSSLMRCRMSFFDSTPIGRILNRLSRDMDCVDILVPEFCEFLSQRILIVIVQLVVPIVAYPFYAVVVFIIFALYGVLWRCLVTGIRNTKHIENVIRSPLLQHLTSTVSGLSVIRAYNKQEMVLDKFEALLDRHTSSHLTFRLAMSWFCLRADELGLFMLAAITSVLLLMPGAEPSEAGLILSLIYDTVIIMPFMVMLCAELAAHVASVERCAEYTQGLDYEAPAAAAGRSVAQSWPERGAVSLQSVSLRYRADLPRVLHDVTVDVTPGQKVGIVGRTGAGKSTLIATLLRLMELESGRIVIDGVDIARISLKDLRSRIAVIPQDPVLFSGTIRENLDPFSSYADDQVWHVLERSGLKAKVSRLVQQLQTPVTSDGDNFSVGERQLICLARALLRRNRILLLDEATASVDVRTDQLIQRTIQDEFHDCTVLTIAHRLNTVLAYDSIIVMDAGKVAESGPPRELAARPCSVFGEMLAQAGISSGGQSGPEDQSVWRAPEAAQSGPEDQFVWRAQDAAPLAEQETLSEDGALSDNSPRVVTFDIGDGTDCDASVDTRPSSPKRDERVESSDGLLDGADSEPDEQITRL